MVESPHSIQTTPLLHVEAAEIALWKLGEFEITIPHSYTVHWLAMPQPMHMYMDVSIGGRGVGSMAYGR